MGLMSWLFPSPEDRLAQARKALEREEYARARDLAEVLEIPGAEEVAVAGRAGLVRLNLREAEGLANGEDFERAAEHLALAREFARGAMSPELEGEIRAASRTVRGARAASRERVKKGLELANDPSIQNPGQDPEAEGDPLFSLPPDDPRLRYAMALEQWPEDLRERLIALGADFAGAVTMLDQGHAQAAVEALTPFVAREPVARYERARAAQAAGNLNLAVSDLLAFTDAVGHHQIGPMHTGSLLCGLLMRLGRSPEALSVAEAGLKKQPESYPLQGARALALEGLGRWGEADEAAVALVKKAPRDLGLYRLMARCRIRADKRVEAMQVLEAGLTRNCTSGRCGSQPFDVDAGRMLARLYLEDRMEPQRAGELVGQIKGRLQRPGPFEAYLDALSLRNANSPDADDAARRVLGLLKPDHPLRAAVLTAFPGAQPSLTG